MILLASIPFASFGRSNGPTGLGPPAGRTGAPTDGPATQTCGACHRNAAALPQVPNTEGGSVAVSVVNYIPGQKQTIGVRITDTAGLRWGFQLTARLKTDETKVAGTFTANDDIRVRCGPAALGDTSPAAPCNGEVEFASHSLAATKPGTPNPGLFSVEWTPPAANVGEIIFYVAGNATNNSNTNVGDHIYTTNVTIQAAASKPLIAPSAAVVNGASFQAAISPNSWITIRGTDLAGSIRTWGPADFSGNSLPKTLDGVGVNVNNRAAYVYYISPTQINALAPGDTASGNISVEVVRSGLRSDPAPAVLNRVSPAFFVFKNDKYAAATHADGKFVGPTSLYPGASTPAKPGEVIALYGTGFGVTNPAIPEGLTVSTALELPTRPGVRIGSLTAEVQFAGLTAAGLYQINVKIPDQTPDGDHAVVADMGGVTSPAAGVLVTVAR